jgi:hypothetical protein
MQRAHPTAPVLLVMHGVVGEFAAPAHAQAALGRAGELRRSLPCAGVAVKMVEDGIRMARCCQAVHLSGHHSMRDRVGKLALH